MNTIQQFCFRCLIVILLHASYPGTQLIAQNCETQSVQLTLPDNITIQPGEQFCFDVEVANFNNMVLFFFVINFNSTVLQFDSADPLVSGLTGFTAGDVTPPTMRDPDVIRILWSHPNLEASTLPDNSPIINLCFTAIGDPGIDGRILFNDTGLGSPAEFLDDLNNSYTPCNPNPGSGVINVVPEESNNPQIFVTGQCGSASGADEGIVELKVFYGTPPYTIASSQGNMVGSVEQDVFVFNNLPLGAQSFTAVDADGLSSNDLSINITDDPAFNISVLTQRAPNCPTDFNGRIELEIEGGKPFENGEYFFDWGEAQIGLGQNELKDLTNGTYSVTILDSLGCKQSASYTLERSPIEVVPTNISPALCEGRNNGIIQVSATGGGPYENGYIWNIERLEEDGSTITVDSRVNPELNPEFRLLQAGNYRITARDSIDRRQSCSNQQVFEVSIQRDITTQLNNDNTTGESCNSEELIAGLDINASSGSLSTPINVQLIDSADQVVFDEAVTTTSVTTPCLNTGKYTVRIEDAEGCTDIENIFLIGSTILLEDSLVSNPSCPSLSDGFIKVDITTSNPPLNFEWSTGQSGSDIDSIGGLSAGPYSVTVTDDIGSSEIYSFNLTDPEAISLSITQQEIVCPGLTGQLFAEASGGIGELSYLWLPDSSTNSVLADAPAGVYTVEVRDENGCMTSQSSELIDKVAPDGIISNVNAPSCVGQSDGTAVLTITPSVDFPGPNYISQSSTGLRNTSNNLSVDNFPAGSDNFIIFSDSEGTCVFDTVFVDIPEAIPFELDLANSTITEISCFGDEGNDGAIVNLAAIGPTNLSFNWLEIERTGPVQVGLGAGIYTVELAVGECSSLDTIIIEQPDSLQVTIDSSMSVFALCGGDNNTEIVATQLGGTPEYNFNWEDESGNNISTDSVASNLAPGLYTYEVTDANDCSTSIEVVVEEPDVVVAEIGEVNDPLCNGDQGFITIANAEGGIGEPYRYQVNTAPAIPIMDTAAVIPGDLVVRVFDQNGCSWDTMITILEPLNLDISLGPDENIELGQSVDIQAIVTSDSSIDTILWTPAESVSCIFDNCTEVNVAPVLTTQYEVRAIDINGCEATDEITVSVQRTSNIYIPNAFSPSATVPGNSTFKVFGGSGVSTVESINIFDRYGNLVHSEEETQPIQLAGVGRWQGFFNENPSKKLESGVYMYIVEFAFLDGGTEIRRGNVTLIR